MNFEDSSSKVEQKLKYNCWKICLGLAELIHIDGVLEQVVDLVERGAAGDDYFYMILRFLNSQKDIKDRDELAIMVWKQMDATKYLKRTTDQARDSLELFVRFAGVGTE